MQAGPYSKRTLRARVRETRLAELGYDSYSAYLASAAWRDVRKRYRESDLPQACMCGATNWQLHHTTYDRVGQEELEDLVPLCTACHAQAHALEQAGVIGLDLKGFYYDPERAAEGRLYLAQLDALCPDGAILRSERRRDTPRRAKKRERLAMMKQRNARGRTTQPTSMVYVVSWAADAYDPPTIYGIYTSEAQAEKARSELDLDGVGIAAWELDATPRAQWV